MTGAARGLGRAFCEAVTAHGARVVACDLSGAGHEIEGLSYVANVADPDDVRKVVDGAVAAHSRIDILVNNAGVGYATGPGDGWDRALADYDEIVGTNTRGSFLFGRAVAPVMIAGGGGHIVNFADHPHTLIGSVEAISEQLQSRRETYGISYITVSVRAAEAFAPVVERLHGT